MKNQNLRIIVSSVLVALILSSFMSIASFSVISQGVRSSVLRLHIKANSDSKEDQQLKLKVRDEILRTGEEIFFGAKNLYEAEKRAENAQREMKKTAERVIRENGFDYTVDVTVGVSFFPTRTYENDITLPAGKYMAVKINIGQAKGKNWWCVMFPPMCLPAASEQTSLDDVLSSEESELVKSNPKYEVRFKIVELYEKILSIVK